MATDTTAASGASSAPAAPGAPRRRPARSFPRPVVLDHRDFALNALDLLGQRAQAMAFVVADGALVGVVTVEDLRFVDDWAGHAAVVADAMTLVLVEVGLGATAAEASEAFGAGLRGWLAANQGRLRPVPRGRRGPSAP